MKIFPLTKDTNKRYKEKGNRSKKKKKDERIKKTNHSPTDESSQ